MALLYHDLLQHAADYLAGFEAKLIGRLLPGVVRSAFDMIAVAMPWPELVDVLRVGQTAPQTTGTIAIAADGMAVTLTGSTWPTWSPGAVLVADSRPSLVQHRDSSTVIQLHPDFAHTVSLAAGASYALYRTAYPLPADVRRVSMPFRADAQIADVSFEDWLALLRAGEESGTTTHVAVGRDPVRSPSGDGLALWCWPLPSGADALEVGIERWIGYASVAFTGGADPLAFANFTGRATTTPPAATVTFTAGNLPTQVARGSRIRFSTNATNQPTIFAEEAVVLTRDSATQVTLTAATSQAYAAVMYVLSDPVGIDEHVYGEVLRRAIDYQIDVAVPSRRKPAEMSERLYYAALDRAREKASVLGTKLQAGAPASRVLRQSRTIAAANDPSQGWWF